ARNAASSFVLDVSGAIVVPAPPAAPAVSVAPGQGRLTVKWNPPPGGAVAYTISSEQLGLTTTVPGSQRSSTFTGLRNGRRHDFRVVAHTLGGASPAGTASATPTTYHPFATPEAFVDRQYRDFLLRAPDPAGRQYWSSLLRSGVTGTQIVSAFLSSPEYEGRVASLVRLYYAYFLRAPDT